MDQATPSVVSTIPATFNHLGMQVSKNFTVSLYFLID